MKLDQFDPKIANGACPDSDTNRPVLNNVALRDGRLATADGFMLVVRDANIDNTDPLAIATKTGGQVLIPARIMRLLKPTATRQMELVSAEDGSITAKVKDEVGQIIEPTLNFTPTKLPNFPRYEELFPPAQKKAEVAVDIKLLRKLLQCLPNNGVLRIGLREKNEPIEFYVSHIPDAENDDRPIRACLMPMMAQWTDFKWWRDIPKKKPEKKEVGK